MKKEQRIWEINTKKVTYKQWPVEGEGQVMHSLRQECSRREEASTKALRCSLCWEESKNTIVPRQCIKKQRHCFADKGPSSQSHGFSSCHVHMWEVDYKEGCAPKNWCFPTVVLEKTLESPLDCKEIKPGSPKGNKPWILIWRTNAEAEALILWPPDVKRRLIGKDPDAGKDWRQKMGTTEDEMVGWHHWLNVHEFEQAPGDGEGQGSLVCFSP